MKPLAQETWLRDLDLATGDSLCLPLRLVDEYIPVASSLLSRLLSASVWPLARKINRPQGFSCACTRHAHSTCGLQMRQMIQFVALALLQLARPSAALVGPPQLSRSAARVRSPVSQSSSRLPVRWPTTSPPRARLQPLQATAEPTGPVVNKAMVRSIIINQIVVGYSIWLTNGDGRQLLSATQFDPTSLVVGAAGGLAVIAVGRFIEKSPNPLFAELNLSTNMLVLRLFGPKPQPILAGVVSLGVATLVALTEETVFRGVVTSRLAENLGGLPGAGCAILLFALGHINPLALGKETLLL